MVIWEQPWNPKQKIPVASKNKQTILIIDHNTRQTRAPGLEIPKPYTRYPKIILQENKQLRISLPAQNQSAHNLKTCLCTEQNQNNTSPETTGGKPQ
jgi:hypothetical protein